MIMCKSYEREMEEKRMDRDGDERRWDECSLNGVCVTQES